MMLRRSQALPYVWERKRFTGPLDIRTPEDRPVVEQQKTPAAPIRSPAIDKALGDFGEAMRSGLVDAMKHAARSVVDATSAYYRMSGVPTFAHEPVPWQLIEHALPVEHLAAGEHTVQAVGHFVDVFEGSVKPMLIDQISRQMKRGSERPMHEIDDATGTGAELFARDPSLVRSIWNERDEANHNADAQSRPGRLSDFAARDDKPPDALGYELNFNEKESGLRRRTGERQKFGEAEEGTYALLGQERSAEPPIVRPYRRYQTPGMGKQDEELREAERLARDADAAIRVVRKAMSAGGAFDRSGDPLMREFADAMRRYFSDNGDRAVAGVGLRRRELSANARGYYASYDPLTDRIQFHAEFLDLPYHEKIITIIHELLHATLTMKNTEARNGYNGQPVGSKAWAMYEAELDNIAKSYGKKLGLIPQGYAPTRWQDYLKR
ncbi:MAG: hypothetical protein ABL996_03830 [Micropepsaceae bacterium]